MTRGLRRGFTLIELVLVVGLLALVVALLLPSLSRAKERVLKRSYEADGYVQPGMAPQLKAGESPTRRLAYVRSFEATASLTPRLSVGTAEPESIYEARIKAKLTAGAHAANTAVEVHLPLPPQIISLADLAVTVGTEPSDQVELRGDRLVWYGLLPLEPTEMTIAYSAVGKGLYSLETPPGGILETFSLELSAEGSDVRMLQLSLQPTGHERLAGKTVYRWEYKKLLFGRPIALDVLGIAPLDRLGELSWLGPASVVVFGLLIGLVARAYNVESFDRWMLLLTLGAFTGAYPLMYFAQEFVSLGVAMAGSSVLVLGVIAIRCITMMGWRLAVSGIVAPAAAVLAATLVAATRTQLQGIIITAGSLAVFVVAMLLLPRIRIQLPALVRASAKVAAEPASEKPGGA